MKLHASSGSPEPYGFRQEDFKDLFSMATSFHWNQVLGKNSDKGLGRIGSVKFIKI